MGHNVFHSAPNVFFRLFHLLFNLLMNPHVRLLVGRLVGWLVGNFLMSVCYLVICSAGWFVCWLMMLLRWLADRLVGWWVGRPVGWLAGRLVGLLFLVVFLFLFSPSTEGLGHCRHSTLSTTPF